MVSGSRDSQMISNDFFTETPRIDKSIFQIENQYFEITYKK
jgi:hypothetical protein